MSQKLSDYISTSGTLFRHHLATNQFFATISNTNTDAEISVLHYTELPYAKFKLPYPYHPFSR